MNEQWQSFISKYPSNSINSDYLDNACIFDLSAKNALLEFTGEDAKTYLQGQLTNDINDISNEHSQLSGYCNPKGRLLALFHIFSINDKIYLQFPVELLPKILKRMRMFVMMSKVTIKDVSEELINVGLAGNNISEILKQQFDSLTDVNNSVLTKNGITLITISGINSDKTPRYQCLGSSDALISFCTELFSKDVFLQDNDGWTQLDIQSGLPRVVPNTVETFVPQMLNLHRLNGINFKKGCYTGQEIVARMHYLGKLKRLMYQLKFNTDKLPKPGDSLYSPESTSGQGAGKIVLASISTNTLSSEKEVIALAVLEISTVEKDAIFIDEACTIKATIVDLPYSLDES
ncbi:MAG: folate-binding protein [Pseudomonadota bacterium]